MIIIIIIGPCETAADVHAFQPYLATGLVMHNFSPYPLATQQYSNLIEPGHYLILMSPTPSPSLSLSLSLSISLSLLHTQTHML